MNRLLMRVIGVKHACLLLEGKRLGLVYTYI